jgi:hypothetical protein
VGGQMDANPTRFAVAATAALTCAIVGLLVGMRAGGGNSSTDHLVRLERTTTLAAPQRADAAARTVTTAVTRTVTQTVRVPVTVTAAAPPTQHPGEDHASGKGHGPDKKPGPGKGPGPG